MLTRASPSTASAGRLEDDCVARARAIAPVLASQSARMEREREITAEVLSALHEARLFRMLLPRSCDGWEIDPATFMQAVEELAKADASTAWCVAQASGCSMSAAYLAPEVAQKIFGDARAVMAWGPSGSGATAVPVEGGYRATGSWSFASGIKHANWLGCHCTLLEPDGSPRMAADGKPAERTLLIPKEQAEVTDVWRVVGLRATGSDPYAIEDLFVPAAHTFLRESAEERRETGPLYRVTTFHLYGIGFAGIALGIARAALDSFITVAVAKVPLGKTSVLRDNAVVQSQVALAEAKLQSSRSFMLQTLHAIWQAVTQGDEITLAQRAALKLAGTYAAHQAKDVVDAVYHAAGATAIFDTNPFERRFRDIHTLIQQVQSQFANFEMVGQVLLGLPSPSKLI